MNILYLSPGQQADYQCDMLFLGLRQLFGASVVDHQRMSHMYCNYSNLGSLYGHGFTLYGLLPDIPVDRRDVGDKIAKHFYDLVIFASVQRYQSLIDLVALHYKRHEVLLIDGEDQQQGLYGLRKWGLYFKRELREPQDGVFPIHFAVPREKIGTMRGVPKTRVRAFIDPRDRSTYIYTTEAEYYRDYAESLFAFTMRKGGFDCLRHYEIMANGCIPLFLDLHECPHSTCMQLPKPELEEAMTLMDYDGTYWDTEEGHQRWLSLHRRIHVKFACHSTTERLAQYVIETQQREAAQA